MKHIINIAIILLTFFSCKAQNPIVAIDASPSSTPDGAYFKDLNNEFDRFIGTWKFIDGNTSFTLMLKKKELYFNGTDYEDIILGEYIYIENNIEIVNYQSNFNNPIGAGHKIVGNLIIPTNMFVNCDVCEPNERRVLLNFSDPERNYLSASIVLRYLEGSNPEQITATIISAGGGMIPNENSPTELRVPYGEYLMVKQ
ncbi:DUF6705 family protein [Bizionia paragorgiae]|uniref:DUF6705 family protein n=1 Tax=Bizionia paragorgiae TaxID=283786 RepID=UPI00299EC46C|nr:DUF6705 family protein [Bizionia paragorgiae]MDX1272311.1 DUF6705 family protein [Bizionia paragorgiae]